MVLQELIKIKDTPVKTLTLLNANKNAVMQANHD